MNQKNAKINARHVGVGSVSASKIGKTQKGITLIALVITIIVLLILAGVTINMMLGDDGIIAQAQSAKERNEEASDLEVIKLAYLNEKANELNPKFETDKTIEERMEIQLENTYGEGKVDVEKDETGYEVTIFKDNNKIYNILTDGTVKYMGDAIELTSAEDIYALSRILAFPAAKVAYINKDASYNIEDDFNRFDIPVEITEENEKIEYLQTASYALTEDVNLTIQQSIDSNYFLGIGNRDIPFEGTFDGNAHTITLSVSENLQRTGSDTPQIGLFGTTTDAKILDTNVELSNDMIIDESTSTIYLGVLVGTATSTEFRNCSVTVSDSTVGCTFTATGTDAGTYVGGFVGFSARSIYKDCIVTLEDASIEGTGGVINSTATYALRSAGGFMGFSNPGSNNETNIGRLGNQLFNCEVISNNTTQKDVIVASIEAGQEVTAGGFVGCTFNNFLAKNCSVEITKGNIVASKTGDTDISSYYGSQAGGFIGRLEHTGELFNCIVTGDYLNILAKSPNNLTSAGGIVGVDVGPYHRDVIAINNCYFDGSNTSNIKVEITSTDVIDSKKTVSVGGIVGNGTYKINNCSVKNVAITNKSTGISNPSGAGDIAGYITTDNYVLWPKGKYFTPGTPGITDCEASGITFDVSDNVTISN